MGIPKLLRKVFLLDLLQGLKVTFRYQDPREIYTEQYPLQRPQVAERYRGAPRLNVNPDSNETMCIACDLCALACPENLIVVTSARNEHTRRKELTNFTYDLSYDNSVWYPLEVLTAVVDQARSALGRPQDR